MKCSLGISNFLEEISSFPFYFPIFRCIDHKEGFLIFPCYSLKLCIQMGMFFLFSFASCFFSQLFVRPPQNHFTFLHFFFLGMVLVTASCTVLRTPVHCCSGTLSIRSNPLNLFVTFTI